jgi:hypothetical protein
MATNLKVPGRRIGLLLWNIFNRTPLDREIDEQAERDGAAHCKMSWPDYLALKAGHPDLWQKAARKRSEAKARGYFLPQPWQLMYHRKINAPARAKRCRNRPRFAEWAAKKLLRQRTYKQAWRRGKVLDRLMTRVMGL